MGSYSSFKKIVRSPFTRRMFKWPSIFKSSDQSSLRTSLLSRRARRRSDLAVPSLRDRKGRVVVVVLCVLGLFAFGTLAVMSIWILTDSEATSKSRNWIRTSGQDRTLKRMLVMGMSRSGTSLTTSIIAAMKANWLGSAKPFTKEMEVLNPKGYFERADVIRLNWHYLGSWLQIDWKDPSKVGSMSEANQAEFNNMAKKIVDDMDKHAPWVLKDPRFCILLPYWIPILQDPVCIIVFRHPLEVKASSRQRKTDPVSLWETYTTSALRSSSELCSERRILVSHASLLQNTIWAVRELSRKLIKELQVEGLQELTNKEILDTVEQELYHNRISPDNTEGLTHSQICLWNVLRNGTAFDDFSCS